MKIAILNDCFFNKSHLERFKKIGDIKIFNNTNSKELAIERLNDADVAVVDQFLTTYDKEILQSTKNLKLLVLNTTAFSDVDLSAASELGIKVANVPGFSKESVAELAVGLMFAVLRKIPKGDKLFRSHPMDDLDPVSLEGQSFMGYEVNGKTLGVLGLGNTGSAVSKLALGLGMKVLGFNRSKKNLVGVKQVDFETLLENSDVISLHLPLNTETEKIIGRDEFSKMKKSAVLLNLGRGKLVDTDALHEALDKGTILGAGLDVVDIKSGHPLLKSDKVVFTPHIGSYTKEAYQENLPEMIVSNVENFIGGKPSNIVN